MIVKLLTEHHLEVLSLKSGCTGSCESTLVKMPHCWKFHALAQLFQKKILHSFILRSSFADTDEMTHYAAFHLGLYQTRFLRLYQGKVPTLYWLPKLHKNPIQQDLLRILVLV